MVQTYVLNKGAAAPPPDDVEARVKARYADLFRGWEDIAVGRDFDSLRDRARDKAAAMGHPFKTQVQQMAMMTAVMKDDAEAEQAAALAQPVAALPTPPPAPQAPAPQPSAPQPTRRPSGIRVVRAGDCVRSQHHKICITGLSGAGKTVLGTTVPNGVTIVTEAIAIPTIRQWNPDQGIIEAYSVDDFRDAIRWAHQSDEARQYETLVVDSITEAAAFVRRYVAEHSPDRAAMERAQRKGTLSRSDYATYAERMERIVHSIVATPMHVLVLAQGFETEDEMTRTTGLRAAFDGQKFPPRFPGLFQVSGVIQNAMTDHGLERQVLLDGPTGQYIVKGGRGLNAIETPDVSAWIETMNANE